MLPTPLLSAPLPITDLPVTASDTVPSLVFGLRSTAKPLQGQVNIPIDT